MKRFIPQEIKSFIKKYFWRIYYYNKIFKTAIIKNNTFVKSISNIISTDFNIFTKDGEDGILLYLLKNISASNKTFIDIGSNDCINSNCANLAFHHGWNGCFIDGDIESLNRGKYIYSQYFKKDLGKFSFLHTIVKPDNINELLKSFDMTGEIDLMTMDLDGNDYHIWHSLEVVKPKIVVVEVQIEKGNEDFVPKYSNTFELYEDKNPKGASPLSMAKLAAKKGYKLIAANKGGFNLFFVRNDLVNQLKVLSVFDLMYDLEK
ncbi:MAG: hypothetical protein ABL929_04150 [Ferruginibacter sp.]|nr:hypothetical protein [Ferruginibacter sp.]